MKVLKLAASLFSAVTLALVAATPAEAAHHESIVSGFEFYATATQGHFAGTASAHGSNGLSGLWKIVVNHSQLNPCTSPDHPCAWVTGGSFVLAVTSPSIELVSGSFSNRDLATEEQPDVIKLVYPGPSCTNEVYWITDGLHGVGSSQHAGTGSFTAYLTHYRALVFGHCLTYSATVSGKVVLEF